MDGQREILPYPHDVHPVYAAQGHMDSTLQFTGHLVMSCDTQAALGRASFIFRFETPVCARRHSCPLPTFPP